MSFEGWAIAIVCACYFVGGKGFAYQRLGAILFVGVTSYDDEIRKAERQKGQVEDFIERIALVEGEQKDQLKKLEKEKAVAERAKETKEEFDTANVILQQSRHFTAKEIGRASCRERV